MLPALIPKAAKLAANLKPVFRQAGKIYRSLPKPEPYRMKPYRSSRKKPKQLTQLQFLRGDGDPSAYQMATMLAATDMLLRKIDRPPSWMPSWIQAMVDAIHLALRTLAYEILFLLLRLVCLIIGYIVTAAFVWAVFYWLFLM